MTVSSRALRHTLHPKLLTVCLLATIGAWNLALPALSQALSQELSRVGTEPPAIPSATVQYYQDYQSLPAAAPPSDRPIPAPPVTPQLPPSAAPQASAATAPTPTLPEAGQVTSLAAPIWVVPPPLSVSTAPTDALPVTPVRSPVPAQPPVPTQSPAPTGVTSGTPRSDIAVIVTDVQVVGADAELQQIARNVIKTQPGQTTTATALQQDVAAILETGWFADVTVLTQSNSQGIGITFQLAPIVVRSLQLSGAEALTPDVANQLFQPQLGVAANSVLLSQSVQRTNQWYAQNGYPLARVLTVQPSRSGVVTIAVAEGTVRSVRVRFLTPEGKTVDANGQPIRVRTQPAFVQRQIQLQPGQPFRTETAREDLRRLSQLGIFQTANVSFEGDARQTDVIYNVVEGKSRGFNFGGGYNDELGLYGTINYQDTNFGGLAQQASANVQIGTQDIQYNLRFQSPYRATDPSTPGYGFNFFRRQGLSRVFDDEIKLPNGSRVRERRLGGGINLEYPVFGPEWVTSLGLNYTNISLRDREGDIFRTDRKGNPLTLSGKGIDDLYTVSFSAIRDRRDNPANPGNGSLINLSTEQSIPIGRGSILGNRLLASYSQYIPVEWIKFAKADQQFPQVFAVNVQGGTVLGDLPPYDAFTLGGPNSVRGYDTGEVATSRTYVLLSTEYRFPIYRFIGGALFADFATDLGSQDSVLGDPGGDRDKPGSGFGGGVGLRFNSPIGIIRADFGVSNQGDTRFQFGFGQRF